MSVRNLGHKGARGEVIRAGHLKKLKTMRRKWFVLRGETSESSARLEYYDTESKFKKGGPPKRSIPLRTCFNITKRTDTKSKNVIALYTKDDCFCIVLESDEEQSAWLDDFEKMMNGDMTKPSTEPRVHFGKDGRNDGEQSRDGVGEKDSKLDEAKGKGHTWPIAVLNRGLGAEFTGQYRLCLNKNSLSFFKKVENTPTLELKLSNIRTCGCCQNFFCLEVGRSSHLGAGELWMLCEDAVIAQNMYTSIYSNMKGNKKEIPADDLTPKARTRSSSATEATKPNTFQRKQVVSGVPKAHIFSQASGGVGSTTISHQRTQSLPLTDHHTIFAPPLTSVTDSPNPNPNTQTIFSRVGSVAGNTFGAAAGSSTKRTTNQTTAKCPFSSRERCDSMPSRQRTTSETTHPIPMWKHLNLTGHRSSGRDSSHSPPSGSPVSPPSVGCSTDSTGSSYSLADERDLCLECSEAGMRYSGPMTPDEAIAEEDCTEGSCGMYNRDYVHMGGPQSSDDGCYMDMSPRCRFLHHHHHSTNSPTVSMSSVTSGTPSTDMRFSDYPLDKVSSYFTAEDDDARPARAYSVGSRPETCRNKRHIELPGTPEDCRTRAFSVGSRTKKVPSRVLPPHHHGVKSSSAPILSNSRSHSSHSSLGPMDDLMEMDFSRSNTGSSTNSEYANVQGNNNRTTSSGYVEMKPGVEIKRKLSSATTTNADVSPYVDMSGGAYMDMSGSSPSKPHILAPQQEEYTSFVDINRQYRIMTSDQPLNNNYLDMEHRSRTVSNSSGSHTYGDDYLDMTGSQHRVSQFSTSMSVSPNKIEYMPLSFQQQDFSKTNGNISKTPDGYVEMTLGSKKNQRQPSIDSGNQGQDNSTAGGGNRKPNSSAGTTKKTVSQPITITQTTSSSQVIKNSSSPISISSLLGRKSSTNTPPKMHLPLTPWSNSSYSSLPRQRNRKDSQNSKDNSSSSSVTTPSSSSTIFPLSLNSPSSPMRPQVKTETPSSLKIPSTLFNALYKAASSAISSGSSSIKPSATITRPLPPNSDDYTMMDFEKPKPIPVDTSEYVNYAPATVATTPTVTAAVSVVTPTAVATQAPLVTPEADDYALMEPDVSETARVTTCNVRRGSSDGVTSPLITQLSAIGIRENQSMLFRPIKEDSKMAGPSPTADMVSRKSECPRQGSSSSSSTESPYETLQAGACVSPAAKISRPNSVSSDTIKTTSPRICEKNRPASVSSDTSRGVVTSRPSSTSSELWSSSSTLVGSRPESVNSDAIHPDSQTNAAAVGTTEPKIHYANLDLAPNAEDEVSRSPTTVKSQDDGSAQEHPESTFYAKIDFVVSDGLKQNNQILPSNARVKH